MDIKYNVLNYDSTHGNTRLELNIKGNDINYIILNTLRRTIMTNIPIYAFTEFNFKKNKSIFNGNYLKLRLKNLPVWGLENKIDIYTPEKANKNNIDNEENNLIINEDMGDDNEDNKQNDLNSSTLNQLTMYVDYTSTSKEIVTVTTDHAKFYYSEKKIDCPYPVPIPLVKLQPEQSITFSAITSLGIEKMSAIFSAISVCFYIEKNPNEYNFIIESKGQLDEKRIIEVAIINIINKLENISKNLSPVEDDSKTEGEIVLMNEDNTMGNLLTHGLQNHKAIKFAGYNIPHLLVDKAIIHYELKSKGKINDVLNDVIEDNIKLFKKLQSLNKSIKLK
jgi:DNA-directed RNA polymerase subunit L